MSKKSKKKYSWIDTGKERFLKLQERCPPNHYIVVAPAEAKSLVPVLSDSHLGKADSVLIMCSGTATGQLYYMANINRVEKGFSAIDQDPLGFVIQDGQAFPSGCYVHHGDWLGRTINPPQGFVQYAQASGMGNCFPLPTMPPNPQGTLDDMKNTSQAKAFDDLLSRIAVVE